MGHTANTYLEHRQRPRRLWHLPHPRQRRSGAHATRGDWLTAGNGVKGCASNGSLAPRRLWVGPARRKHSGLTNLRVLEGLEHLPRAAPPIPALHDASLPCAINGCTTPGAWLRGDGRLLTTVQYPAFVGRDPTCVTRRATRRFLRAAAVACGTAITGHIK